MPDLNHRFQTGRMNKDLDERLVPNGEYRDAMNAQVSTTDDSDIGSLQNIMGNLDISSAFFIDQNGDVVPTTTLETYGFYCVGSILDEKTDRLYWLVSGAGIDFIAEYDYNTKKVSPIVVDIFQPSLPPGANGRILNYDKSYLITGINIVDETLFWTDNNTEPKRINIPQIRIGTTNFFTHTEFFIPNPFKPQANTIPFVSVGDLKEEHITVIKKSPQIAPTLEMKNTSREDQVGSGPIIGEIQTTLGSGATPFDITNWYDYNDQQPKINSTFDVTFDTDPDFKIDDILIIESFDASTSTLKKTKILVQIVASNNYPNIVYSSGRLSCTVELLSWDNSIDLSDTQFNVYLSQEKALFEFRFPRFATRYKYKDGEYSSFSPFSEVAFLPGEYDYLPKEGYNLAMVNRVRQLGVCKFIDKHAIPDDVVSIDVLYKESDSPSVFSIKTIDKITPYWSNPQGTEYDSWNAISPTGLRTAWDNMHGYVDVQAEMIHSLLPSNQLLRNYDNVPRKALAQEVIGNRLVYANYLQNFNMSSSKTYNSEALRDATGVKRFRPSNNITTDLKLNYKSLSINDNTSLIPEQLDAGNAYNYKSAKTIKSLRTYQLGVIYIDEYGRETPVFSTSKNNANTTYVSKTSAPQQTKLQAQILNAKPDFAKSFKFLVKETTSEYYNLAMDRWYPAEDGNIWLSFPSSDRNKVDLETFLILKKAHESNEPVTNKARYKILDIENEAPAFIKTKRTPVRTITDGFVQDAAGNNVASIFMVGSPTAPGTENSSYPFTGGRFIDIHKDFAEAVQNAYDESLAADIASGGTRFQFRIISSQEGASNWYDLKSVEISTANDDYIRFRPTKEFGVDMGITTIFDTQISPTEPAYSGNRIEFITRQEKNLPEFEGRFFVKILKDATLTQNILGYEVTTGAYSVSQSIKSQYINPNSPAAVTGSVYDPGTAIGASSWYGVVANGNTSLVSVDNDNNDNGYGAPGGNFDDGVGQDYWELAGKTENNESQSSGWFIDSIEGFRAYESNNKYFVSPSSNYANSSYLSITTSMHMDGLASYHSDGSIKTHNDLYDSGDPKSAFDNAHPGYNYGQPQRPQQMMQLIGDGTNHISGGQGGPSGGYLENPLVKTPIETNVTFNPFNTAYPGTSVIRRAPISDGGGILPGVGISENNMSNKNSALITLSFAGTNQLNKPVEDFDSLSNVKSYFTIADNANDYVDQTLFINTITSPGAIWRWKEDPGQVVYRTLPLDAASTSFGTNASIWAANEFDTIDNYPGVSLYNYAYISDYSATHTRSARAYLFNPLSWSWFLFGSGTYEMNNLASYGLRNYQEHYKGALPVDASNFLVQREYNQRDLQVVQEGLDHFGFYGNRKRYPTFTSKWNSASNKRRRFTIHCAVFPQGGLTGTEGVGGVSPHFYKPTNNPNNAPHFDQNGDVLTTLPSTPAPGIRPDGMYSGYDMTGGASGGVYYTLNSNNFTDIPKLKMQDGSGNISPAPGSVTWQLLESYTPDGLDEGYFTLNPAVWETEPKDNLGLEIYHEVGQVYPTELTRETLSNYIGPIHPQPIKNPVVTCFDTNGNKINLNTAANNTNDDTDIRVSSVTTFNDQVFVYLIDVNYNPLNGAIGSGQIIPSARHLLVFTRPDGSSTSVQIKSVVSPGNSNKYELFTDVHNYRMTLPFFNAYSFGNGVESNRIRDDFNQVTIDKGPKVSAVLEEPYKEERRSSGLIYSGIYNSISGINNLNQFIQAEKITKDLNPSHGSIQKLFARNTDLVTFCEDKVFKILANKDALFNADGNPQLTATENVLGQTVPFAGDYGISTNPESFAYDNYRLYFSDRTRGTVLRLSMDGLTPISQYGMSKWFADNLPEAGRVIGSFDDKKKEYNISLDYTSYESLPVGILSTPQFTFAPAGQPTPPPTYAPVNVLTATYKEANKIQVGDTIYGAGIPVGTIVTSKINLGGGLYKININNTPDQNDVSVLGNPIPYGIQVFGVPGDSIYQTRIYSSSDDKEPYTLSYSERSKGWPSFKSFYFENGLSLNNEYFTFKSGLLYQHHANELYNTFYNEFTESSVEVIFNEQPGSVKSFQTIDYEGTQSKISIDVDNSGEYWDNYEKTGWYVDNMYTNLQEVEPEEFKNKEGKWFSTIKGVATEWLDDGNAGNIDTRELSYQGIDELKALTFDDDDFTSWDCQQKIKQGAHCPYGVSTGGHPARATDSNGSCSSRQSIPIYPTTSGNPGASTLLQWFWDNPSENVDNWRYPVVGNALSPTAPADICLTPSTDPMYNSNFTYNTGRILKGFSLVDSTLGNVVGVYKTIDDVISELIRLCPDTGYFKGMTYAEYTAINTATPPGSTVSATHICVEIQGVNGTYSSLSQCENDPNSKCNTDCSVPNLVTVHPVNGIPTTVTNRLCIGSVSVEVYLSGTATSWNVHYEDMSGVTVLVDNTTYTVGGYSSNQQLNEGSYNAVVVDDLGCKTIVAFDIECDQLPCQTSPGTFNVSKNDPTFSPALNRCWEIGDANPGGSYDGSISITNFTLLPPATTWGYELYINAPNPWNPFFGQQNLVASGSGFTAQQGDNIQGLEQGVYTIKYTDNTGCVYNDVNVILECVDFCVDTIIIDPNASPGEDIISSDSDDCTSITGFANGSHEVLQIVLPASVTSYNVQYYSYTAGTQFDINTATPVGSLQGPFTSISNNNGNIGFVPGLESTAVSGNSYMLVWTAQDGCKSFHSFDVPCNEIVPCTPATNPTCNFQVQNTTSIECLSGDNEDAKITWSPINIQTNATSCSVQLFWYDLNTNTSQIVFDSGNLTTPVQQSVSTSQANPQPQIWSSNNPNYNGYWYFTITDNLGCQLYQGLNISCNHITSSSGGDCGINGVHIPDDNFEKFLETRQGYSAGVSAVYSEFWPGSLNNPSGAISNNSDINDFTTNSPAFTSSNNMGNNIKDNCVNKNRIDWVSHLDISGYMTLSSMNVNDAFYPNKDYYIKDITGIGAFINLTHFIAARTFLHNPDFSVLASVPNYYNSKLKYINIPSQQGRAGLQPSTLTSFVTGGQFSFNNTQPLNSVNVTGLDDLRLLGVRGNVALTSIDVTTNTSLEKLFIDSTQISSLDLSNNTNLNRITAENTLLTTLDLSNNPNMNYIYCSKRTSIGTGQVSTSTTFTPSNLTDLYISPLVDLTSLNLDLISGPSGFGTNSSTGSVPYDNTIVHTNTVIHVGSGVVPGTSGGTGANGQQTRVEYCNSQRTTAGSNVVGIYVDTSCTFVA